MQASKNSIGRIIDANINRAKEGLRVCEEVTRFMLNDRSLTTCLKAARHEIDTVAKSLSTKEALLKERSSLKDVGRLIHRYEFKRSNLKDIFFANIQRAKESIRVLEEFSKLINKNCALKFKRARYKLYEIEKKAAGRVSSLCNHR